MERRFLDEPTALVAGSTARLLSRLLRSPHVATVLTNPPAWTNRADVAATVDAIHKVGRAWENGRNQQRRENAEPPGAVVPQSCWTTKRAAEHLRMSQRRVQELAAELGGSRVGREWRLPEVAVREYQRTKAGNAA